VAAIQFDFGLNIATNQINPLDPSQGTDPNKEALVTIDSGRPSSSVTPLPPLSFSIPLTVEWSGDDGDGAGIVRYDIYISVDGGPFGLWVSTTETSAVLNGQLGSTYAFYSIATDGVGNVEEAPPDADTTTVLVTPAPTATSQGSRYLSISVNPAAPGTEHALRVVGPGGCVDAFVDQTGHFVDTPVCLTASEWGTVYVADSDIVPATSYNVYAATGCPDNLVFSAPSTVVTTVWGDLNEDGRVNGHDLLRFIDAYLGNQSYWMGDLCSGGNLPGAPDQQVDGDDLLCWIDAYYGEPYPFQGCGGGSRTK